MNPPKSNKVNKQPQGEVPSSLASSLASSSSSSWSSSQDSSVSNSRSSSPVRDDFSDNPPLSPTRAWLESQYPVRVEPESVSLLCQNSDEQNSPWNTTLDGNSNWVFSDDDKNSALSFDDPLNQQ